MTITKDMKIEEVIKEYPDCAIIFLEQGLHCVGCPAASFETIEQGCKVHGFDDEEVGQLLDELNSFVSSIDKA